MLNNWYILKQRKELILLVDLVIIISIIDKNDIINSKMLKCFFLKSCIPSPINFIINLALNLNFVPRYGLVASSLSLLLTSLLYAGFIMVLSYFSGKRLPE